MSPSLPPKPHPPHPPLLARAGSGGGHKGLKARAKEGGERRHGVGRWGQGEDVENSLGIHACEVRVEVGVEELKAVHRLVSKIEACVAAALPCFNGPLPAQADSSRCMDLSMSQLILDDPGAWSNASFSTAASSHGLILSRCSTANLRSPSHTSQFR